MEGVTGDDGASCGLGGPSGGYSQMDEASLAAKRAKMDGSDSDRLLNFATAADEFELNLRRQKIPRDPMSHRIIEKRRRDRMNNCLADLSRLIPASYHKQGQGRIEKTEIIEMAIKHINMLQQRVEELEKKVSNQEDGKAQAALIATTQTTTDCAGSKFYMGFKEAQDEVMRFLVEVESINTMDPFCKKIMKHLENAGQKFVVTEQKTELSPIDGDNNSQSAMFSHHHHSAFYSTALGGVGSSRNGAGVGQDSNGVGGAGNVGGSGPGSVTPLPEDRMPSVGVGSGVGGVGGVGGDAKSQDDHLRYLLGDQSVNAMTAGGMTVNGQEANDDRTGTLPMFSYSSHLSGMGSGVGSSGYFSDASNMDKNSPSGSTSSRENVYKFKHNITKRFSQEGRHHHHHHHHRYHHTPHHQHTSDTSSNTSSRDLEDDQGQLRWKGGSGKHKSSGSGGGSSSMFTDDMGTENNSPNSDEGNSGNSTSGNSSSTTTKRTHHHHHHHRPGKNGQNNNGGGRTSPDCHISTLASGQPNSTSSVALPGFILHPTGTHYMPISVHNSNISDLFESNDQESMPVFHPISIPVHFRRPVISMPNITICTHLTSKQKDRSIKN